MAVRYARMLEHAGANNARLLQVFPKGFALDATHRPHVTVLQRFVRTADLDKVHAAVEKVLAGTRLGDMEMEAIRPFRFSFRGAAFYQLGQFGTAARKLKAWD